MCMKCKCSAIPLNLVKFSVSIFYVSMRKRREKEIEHMRKSVEKKMRGRQVAMDRERTTEFLPEFDHLLLFIYDLVNEKSNLIILGNVIY